MSCVTLIKSRNGFNNITKQGNKDIEVTMNLNNNTLKEIKNGTNSLIKGTDYTIIGDKTILKKEYLKTVVNGTINLTFSFNPMGEIFNNGDQPATANLTITEIIHAQTPDFNVNLSGEETYAKGDDASTLTVEANVTDGGSITYQWYESNADNTNGIAISGETMTNFVPATESTGLFYYYAVATNTNNAVNGNKTAIVASGIYKVTVNNLEVLAPVVSNDTPKITLQGESEDIEEAVIIDSDKEKLANGSNISIYLKVEKTDAPQADKTAVFIAIDGKTIGQYIDISLIKNIDGIETKVTNTNSPIRITFDVPETLREAGRIFTIVRVHNGIAETLLDLDNDPNTITIETDCFSTYALVYNGIVSNPGESPKTGDGFPAMPLAMLSSILLAIILLAAGKRRNRVVEK